MNNFFLYINKPKPNFCISDNTLDVEIFAMTGENHCKYEYILEHFGEKKEIFLKIDERLVATAKLLDNKKSIYTANINLKNFPEGEHIIKAIFPNDFSITTSTIIEPVYTTFYMKKSNKSSENKVDSNDIEPDSIYTTNKSEIIIDKLSRTFVKTQKRLLDLDLHKCTISINDEKPKPLSYNRDYMFFPILSYLKDLPKKQNKIIISLWDKSSNKKEFRYEFIIKKTQTNNKTLNTTILDDEENDEVSNNICTDQNTIQTTNLPDGKIAEQEQMDKNFINYLEMESDKQFLDEKSSTKSNKDRIPRDFSGSKEIDKHFLEQWLRDPNKTAIKTDLKYFNEIKSFLPPLYPEDQIKFSLKSDEKSYLQILDMLMERVSNALKEKIPSSLEPLKRDGVYTKNGKLTNSAKEFICLALENPIKTLESIGVTITDKEKDSVFPPFQRRDAEKVTKWIYTMQSNKPS